MKSSGRPFFCSSNVEDPPDNGAILNISKIFKAVMSSAAKAELGALYINAREASPCNCYSKKWATSNHSHPSKLTRAQHMGGHQQHPTMTHQSDGHEIPLAMFPRCPRPILILLAPRT